MRNKNLYHIPRKYKKAEVPMLQDDRNKMYNEMDNSLNSIVGLTLQGIYDYKSDDYLVGIHRTASEKEDILKNGIVMRNTELTAHVQPFKNFPFFLREIKYCESYKLSNGCFIVKIPKKDVYAKYSNDETQPIYYKDENGLIRLRPEFVAAYVPVNNEQIQKVELNTYSHNIYKSDTEFFYEEEIENKKKIGY